MDEYDEKFAEMQKYIPFLEAMIERLQNVKDKSREIQLQKMQSLHGILSNSKRKLKIETLQRCEDVLQKLHNKVEKFQGNTPGLHIPNKKSGEYPQSTISNKEVKLKGKKHEKPLEIITLEEKFDETPASPSPPVSPDVTSQTAPIIIPTERSLDPVEANSKPASPDQVEVLSVKPPIIIPTERKGDIVSPTPSPRSTSSNKGTDDVAYSEWDMLEQSELQNTKNKSNWKPVTTSSHDVTSAAKLVGNNISIKFNDVKPHAAVTNRHIPTVPVPSLGGSRRLSSVLEKTRLTGLNLDAISSTSVSESIVSVSEVASPKHKDGHSSSKINLKSTTPLLVSPPPVSTEPPLSMEDLAELLNEEEGDAKTEGKNEQAHESNDGKKSIREKLGSDILKLKKDTGRKATSVGSESSKDSKVSKSALLSQEDIDRENDRRWEEVDKHIVKLTARKCLPSIVQTSPISAKVEALKSNEAKGLLVVHQPSFSSNSEKLVDQRHRSLSPSSKAEPRYADNYERHPRHARDGHDNISDKTSATGVLCRTAEEEASNPLMHHADRVPTDDRSNLLYQRRPPGSIASEISPIRLEHLNQDHFPRQTVNNQPHWPPSHPSPSTNEFCSPQWTPSTYTGMSTAPLPNPMYQHPLGMHQDMWNAMDSHKMNDSQVRPNLIPLSINPGIRPLMSSPIPRPQDINHVPRVENIRDESPNIPVPIMQQPLLSPTGFQVGPQQYRSFPPENRAYDVPFDRPTEYAHGRQSWDQIPGRSNDPPYRGEGEIPCTKMAADGVGGISTSYGRPSTPCPWKRKRDKSRNRAYNRGEGRNGFNRDGGRRGDWSRDGHVDWDSSSRFGRENRAISDRDPRIRVEHGMLVAGSGHSRENSATSVRDPRLAKDKHQPISKKNNKESVCQERDPRKRSQTPTTAGLRKTKDKFKSQKSSSEGQKRDSDNAGKQQNSEKAAKDTMTSPLESLYGVIDTKGKVGQGYGLQKFKIPKIKRPESQSSKTSSKSSENKKNNSAKKCVEKDDATAAQKEEVTSSSDSLHFEENWDVEDDDAVTMIHNKEGNSKEEDVTSQTIQSTNNSDLKFEEADSITKTSLELSENAEMMKKDAIELEGSKLKDEVTQEWIEALIRKSLEFGEGKKLFEQAKLIQKLGEALHAKKFKKIKRIIESESESSSSDVDETVEMKKSQSRKKRRVIVSDSSDEESLADRLGILSTVPKVETSKEETEVDSKTPLEQAEQDARKVEQSEEIAPKFEQSERQLEEPEKLHEQTEEKRQQAEEQREDRESPEKVQIDDAETNENDLIEECTNEKDSEEKEQFQSETSTNSNDDQSELFERSEVNSTNSVKNEENSEEKEFTPKSSKPKAKRRNSLEMLQEDIREMFISEGVVTATGHRMCRILKENQAAGPSNASAQIGNVGSAVSAGTLKKEESSSKEIAEETIEAEDGASNVPKSKKVIKARIGEESQKARPKGRKQAQRVTRQRSKELPLSSDSEEDQPLALRTEMRSSEMPVLPKEKDNTPKSQESETLRRSKRVLLKESVKEPRVVVEKTNIVKVESSKVMFDSSSDESFGIDVAELTAAVDISLSTEKQSTQSQNLSQSSASKKKSSVQSASRKNAKRKGGNSSTEGKVDDAASVTSEGNAVSDLSVMSSTNSEQKDNPVNEKSTSKITDQELLSDVLIGLVPSTEKNISTPDKGSDVDVDEDIGVSSSTEQNQKKISAKKKKKKCNWQMGILSKKKRKKVSLSNPPESDQVNIEAENAALKSDDTSLREDKPADMESKSNKSTDSSTDTDVKKDILVKKSNVDAEDTENDDKRDDPPKDKESLCKTDPIVSSNDEIVDLVSTRDNTIAINTIETKKPCASRKEKADSPTVAKTQIQTSVEDNSSGEVQSEDRSDESSRLHQAESKESTVNATPDKLSIFVCPPELENKEVEIQLERKRKMQEIVENIGIKLHKDVSKKGQSIIDKLKDKMKSNTHSEDNQSSDSVALTSSAESNATKNCASGTSSVPTKNDSNATESSVSGNDTPSKETNEVDKNQTKISDEKGGEDTVKIELDVAEVDNPDVTIQDPLLLTEQETKDCGNELETSDNETTRESATIYESDSSSEQSDNEISTDVNTLLKETSSIVTSSKDPMLTTIQRLAAQLQSTAKPFNKGSTTEHSLTKEQGDSNDTKRNSANASIPKPPNVIPISSIKRFTKSQDSMYQKTPKETVDSNSQRKNFIRLRRLSGDMLSVPGPPLDSQEETSSSCAGSQSDISGDVLQTDTEEECSFLKIENVVSLAPCTDNDESESPIINDIRKAVETLPIRSKGISVLKKSSPPLILKRINSVSIGQPIAKKNLRNILPAKNSDTMKLIPVKSVPATTPIATNTSRTSNYVPIVPKPKIFQIESNQLSFPVPVAKNIAVTTAPSPPSNLNYKILKVVRAPSILKTKENTAQSIAIKLKSSDAYSVMLRPSKLSHLYKCMGRDCRYTTDSVTLYYQHYTQHDTLYNKKKSNPPYDYQKCAYCYMALNDWTQMKSHMEEKHAHCRYQCNYCFYRAIAPSYVQIHQTISHPGNRIGVLLGKLVKELPTKEEINRRDFVQPFICQQECGKYFYIPEAFAAHLKSMHSVPGAIFKCNLCHTACTKIDQLISHYKIHGLYKFQCLYCSNGADTLNTMINHLSMFHCNRLPQILERSLPPQATKDKDIIEQLIIRTPEDSTKLFSEPFNVKCCNPKDKQESNANDTINYDSTFDNGCTESVSNETELANDDSSIEIRTSVSNVDLSGASSKTIPDLTPISKYVPNKASTSLDENTNEKTYFHEPELELLSYANEDVNAVDPLGFPSGLDCPDEFVNINLLDNPDFLKNLHDHSDSSSSVINKYASSEAKGEEDSDVEILDNIDECVKSTTNKPKDEATDKDNSDTAQIVQAKSNDNQDSVASSDKIDDSIASNDKSGNSLKLFRDIEQPLTLEDIKDTGFQGTRLYKCGYENCDYSAETAVLLRTHAKDCTNVGPDKSMCCTHCGKRFVKIGFLLEHLKIHGLKRFGCSLCTMRCSMSYQAMTHMRTKHKSTNSKLIPADPENPSADGLFVVHPITLASDRRGKKRKAAKSEKDPDKLMNLEKSSFSPDEIEALPRQAIYNREVQCAVCPYTTKVRTNIIRHLRLHAKDQTVPETGPVNPVPCLDKKERMFDKMVNLASSSHQNGRMGGKPKEPAVDKEENSIPKFVPEHKRYVCSVAECNYLTVDEAMLRYHLKALHSEEPYFRCPHCPSHGQDGQNVAIDKMGVHLKMHDTRLYKCSHCNHHHYHRHVVERHLTDKHPEKRPFVKVIRELENTENVQQATADEADEEVPDPDGNHWKCNICDYKCVYKAEMITHASVSHDEKSQFKCTACSFKTSGKILFDQHISSKHSGDLNADYIMVYQRIKGINKRCSDAAEQGTQDEPFDTTPLWRRDMPRVRHIRGILLEEEDNKVTASDATAGGGGRPGKRKSDTEQVHVKVSKFKSGKSSSPDEAKQLKEKSKRSLSCEKVSEQANGHHPPTNPAQDKSDVPVNSLLNISDKVAKGTTKVDIDTSLESNDSSESDVGRFGPYGKPDFNMYVCTICNRFKTKYKHDMRDHLFRELKYARWRCKGCGFLSVNRNALLKHFTKHHNGERPDHAPLTPDDAIEDWVGTLLRKQTDMMKKLLLSLKYNTENKNPMANSSQSKISSNARVTKRGAKTDKNSTPDSTKSVVKADLSVSTAKTTSATNNDTNNDTDSGDNDNLVIDIKDDSPAKESEENISESNKDASKNEQDKPLTCKHCKMKFTRWRGLKLHVQITHLKRLGYLCPYCDRSTNSGTLMRQHIRSKHPGCIEKIVSNPAVGEPELSNEFWEKEYGIICPKRRRKRKRKTSVVAEADNKKGKGDDNEPVVQEMCNLCDFTAINCAGLKVHMRIHANQNTLKCKYCTFSGSLEAELWEHWEINHPELPFDVTDLSSSLEGPSPAGAAASEKPTKKRYADSSKPMYSCFYCSVCSHNLESVKNHWSSVHKSSKTMAGLSKCKPYVPFRYKKIQVSAPSAQTAKRIANAEAKSSNQLVAADGTAMPPKRTSSSATQEEGGWICHWCNELCNSKSETKSHQTMFHSHLPFHFKRQDGQKIRSGYTCPECPFTTNFVNEMKNHVAKHIDLFKCKYCEKTYGNLNEVEAHNITEHPESELKVENVTNYEVLLEKLMGRVIWNGNEQIKSDVVKQEACTTKVRRIHAVAKKSTTKSTLRLHGGVSKIKAVARKSTNPLPRYPFGMRFSTTECKNDDDTVNKKDNKPFSFYGRPSSPINLEQLRTYMVIGGHRMQVNCTTLAQLININPQIVVKDIKSDIGSNPAHTNFKY